MGGGAAKRHKARLKRCRRVILQLAIVFVESGGCRLGWVEFEVGLEVIVYELAHGLGRNGLYRSHWSISGTRGQNEGKRQRRSGPLQHEYPPSLILPFEFLGDLGGGGSGLFHLADLKADRAHFGVSSAPVSFADGGEVMP